MKLLEHIRNIFSHGEDDEEIAQTYRDAFEEQESYYVPPFEDQNQIELPTDNIEPSKEEFTAPLENDIDNGDDAVLSQETNVDDLSGGLPFITDNNLENNTETNLGSEWRFQLQKDVIATIEEFDSYLSRIDNQDAKELVSLFQYRLIEALVASGATPIDKDTEFDCLKHEPDPFLTIQNGTPIKKVLRMGLEFNGKVVLKAKVRV